MATLSVEQNVRIPETAEEIRDQILTDMRLEMRNGGLTDPEASVTPESDNYIWATAQANCGLLQYAAIGQVRPSITPLFAREGDLERWRLALRLPVVQPSGASGKVTVTVNGGATITVTANQQFVLPNGLRGIVPTTHVGVSDGSDVSVQMIDPGTRSNADADTTIRWVNPPFNLATQGRVSRNRPLTGGYDAESDARKRERVLNRLGNSPGGGNVGQLREIAFNALASVQACYVHPALGGPSSCKVVILKAYDRKRNDFSRAFDSSAATFVKNKIQEQTLEGADVVVTTAADESLDVALALELPASSLAGGNGTGWLDAVPWPAPATPTRVRVTAVASSRQFTVDAVTAVAPIPGVTRLAWWSPQDCRFRVGLVTDQTGGSGAWVVTVQDPFVDSTNATIAVGDYVSPAAQNLEAYADSYLTLLEGLASGENTADANRLPRAQRNPTVADGGAESGIGTSFEGQMTRRHFEMSDCEIAYANLTAPTVPASVDDPPNVLVPRHLGIYPQ